MSSCASGSRPRERSDAVRPASRRDLDDPRPAIGMARRDDREQPREGVAQSPVGLDQRRLLAGVGRGRGDGRAVADRRLQLAQTVLVGRRLRHVELEIAGGRDARRAEIAVARGIGGGLREAEIEAAQQRRDHAGRVAPAIVGALRHAAVDQDQRNVPLRAHQDQVRPQIGFGEQAEVGLPVIEEARDEARRIERNVLMDDAAAAAIGRRAWPRSPCRR